ncbi:MAG: response regulator [Lachnospiraceae bacterium]|nr:response regulator [Lachnospiraceae bacterium]
MENNLLFVNQNHDIIQEFLTAMEGRKGNLVIDTADSGLEAAYLLKKKKYKVIVTGLDLPTYDGSKIIEYLNRNYPETVCIVYTWRLELANLRLLINERKVFRIFQKPVKYHKLYDAIMDGMVKYDRREIDALNRREMEQELRKKSLQAAELKRVTEERDWEREELVKFLSSLMNVFLHDIESELPGRGKWQLVRYEKKLIFWLLEHEHSPSKSLEEVKKDIYGRFLHPEYNQKVEIRLDEGAGVPSQEFCGNLHFIVWLLLTRFVMISSVYDVRVILIPMGQERFRVRVEGIFPENVWGSAHEEITARVMTSVTQNILECFAERFTQSISDEKIIYYMELV